MTLGKIRFSRIRNPNLENPKRAQNRQLPVRVTVRWRTKYEDPKCFLCHHDGSVLHVRQAFDRT